MRPEVAACVVAVLNSQLIRSILERKMNVLYIISALMKTANKIICAPQICGLSSGATMEMRYDDKRAEI